MSSQLVQQKTAQAELENQRVQLRELTQARNHLQVEVTDLREQLASTKTEISGLIVSLHIATGLFTPFRYRSKKAAQQTPPRRGAFVFCVLCRSFRYYYSILKLFDVNISSELRAVIESYQAKEKSHQQSLENAELARVKAARSEAQSKTILSDTSSVSDLS